MSKLRWLLHQKLVLDLSGACQPMRENPMILRARTALEGVAFFQYRQPSGPDNHPDATREESLRNCRRKLSSLST